MIAFGIAVALPGCNEGGVSQADYDAVVKQSRSLELQVGELEEELAAAKEAAEKLADPNAPDPAELEIKIDELLNEQEERDGELEALKKEFREYKSKYRISVREKIVGKKVARLQTAKGVFEDVEVREITPVGLRIAHRDGSGRVRFEDLDKNLQDQLGYDEEEAAEILEQELEKRAALAQKVAEAREAQAPSAEEKETASKAQMQAEMAKLESWVVKAKSQRRDLIREAASLQSKHDYAKYRGRVSYWGPKAEAARRKSKALEVSISEAERRISQLRKELR